jgi:dUTP pyrophosphatase
MKMNIKYLNKDLPKLSSDLYDSGYDIRASISEPISIAPRGIATIPTGFSLEITDYPTQNNMSVEIQIRPRSGLTKKGIVAQLGTVDVSYRGEFMVNIYNFNDHEVVIEPFDRIAQIVVCPIYKPEVITVEELSKTTRGDKGFGSS